MIELIQLKDYSNKCILVQTTYNEPMCAEFDPGPDENDPFPEYYNSSIEVKFVDLENNSVEELDSKKMKEFYKQITGRKARISYFYLMKYITHSESWRGDCHPAE